ncbi:MAG: hypothetical protein ACP5O1_08695 [Phycisphaerae bacterium]
MTEPLRTAGSPAVKIGNHTEARLREGGYLDGLIAAGKGNWGVPDASGTGRPRQIFKLAAAAAAAKFKKSSEISNNAAVASAAGVANAHDLLDDLL